MGAESRRLNAFDLLRIISSPDSNCQMQIRRQSSRATKAAPRAPMI